MIMLRDVKSQKKKKKNKKEGNQKLVVRSYKLEVQQFSILSLDLAAPATNSALAS